MPENGGFTFFAGAAGVFGVILGWALSLVGLGGKIQKTKGEIERAHTRLDAHDIKFTANDLILAETTQTRIRIIDYDRRLSEIENAIKSVLKMFEMSDGEPRFITRPTCSDARETCHERLDEKMAAGAERFGRLESEVKEVKEAQEKNLETILKAIQQINNGDSHT